MEVVYQVRLGLVYKDLGNMPELLSWIVMDGEYPCLVQYSKTEDGPQLFLITHTKYTTICSETTPDAAHGISDRLSDFFIERVRADVEKDVMRFRPRDLDKLEYCGQVKSVLAK